MSLSAFPVCLSAKRSGGRVAAAHIEALRKQAISADDGHVRLEGESHRLDSIIWQRRLESIWWRDRFWTSCSFPCHFRVSVGSESVELKSTTLVALFGSSLAAQRGAGQWLTRWAANSGSTWISVIYVLSCRRTGVAAIHNAAQREQVTSVADGRVSHVGVAHGPDGSRWM